MLFGIATLIAWYFEMEEWIVQVMIGGVVAMLSILVVVLSIRSLLQMKDAFRRSSGELKRNAEWVKDVIRGKS